jgi:hypothetical protein
LAFRGLKGRHLLEEREPAVAAGEIRRSQGVAACDGRDVKREAEHKVLDAEGVAELELGVLAGDDLERFIAEIFDYYDAVWRPTYFDPVAFVQLCRLDLVSGEKVGVVLGSLLEVLGEGLEVCEAEIPGKDVQSTLASFVLVADVSPETLQRGRGDVLARLVLDRLGELVKAFGGNVKSLVLFLNLMEKFLHFRGIHSGNQVLNLIVTNI